MVHGGPHILTASEGGATATIDDVWVGDVWLCSGQSNMQMGLAETIGGDEAIADLSRQPAIRFLEVPRGGADSPQTEFKAEWKRGSPDSLAGFSAVACYFRGASPARSFAGGHSAWPHQQFLRWDQHRGVVACGQPFGHPEGPAQRIDVRHSAGGALQSDDSSAFRTTHQGRAVVPGRGQRRTTRALRPPAAQPDGSMAQGLGPARSPLSRRATPRLRRNNGRSGLRLAAGGAGQGLPWISQRLERRDLRHHGRLRPPSEGKAGDRTAARPHRQT